MVHFFGCYSGLYFSTLIIGSNAYLSYGLEASQVIHNQPVCPVGQLVIFEGALLIDWLLKAQVHACTYCPQCMSHSLQVMRLKPLTKEPKSNPQAPVSVWAIIYRYFRRIFGHTCRATIVNGLPKRAWVVMALLIARGFLMTGK